MFSVQTGKVSKVWESNMLSGKKESPVCCLGFHALHAQANNCLEPLRNHGVRRRSQPGNWGLGVAVVFVCPCLSGTLEVQPTRHGVYKVYTG